MKKRIRLLTVGVMMAVLAACGSNQGQKESGVQAGRMEPEYGAVQGTDSETAENGETAFSAEPVYEADILRYSEPSGTFSFRKDVEKTQTNYVVYYFESSVPEQERRACIAATDRALSCIGTAAPEIEIVVLSPESYDGILISGNRLYTPVQAWDSVDYLAKVLLAGYGEWSNYGLAYGYADYLHRKAGLSDAEAEPDGVKNHSFVPASVPEVYDLTLLCFDERFVSAQDVEAAKNNACLFVEEYLSSHSEEDFQELLSASGTAEGLERVNGVLEEFYEENGVDCTLTRIRYQYGGVTFDYAAACEYARFYIDKDWQEQYWEANPMITENFLHEDYNAVKAFFEYSERQMRQYQELFGFDNYNNDLSVFISNTAGPPLISFYQQATHTIYIISLTHLAHEYIHSVMFGHCDWNSQWKTEGFARYFSYKYDDYSYDYLNSGYNESKEEYIQKYLDFIDRDIDVRKDFRDLENIIVQVKGYTSPDLITTHYIPGSSFVGFLVDRYGEQAVIKYTCSDNEYNAEWDKSYEELVQEWNAYIEERYSEYSRK